MGDALAARLPARTFGSKRLLALAGDDRLVEQIRRGNERAFEVAFERHGAGILGFCRHMLGSLEEAEDAVQHTFAAAYSDLQRGGERTIALKPWLYTIARNRCLSVLRARREQAAELEEIPTDGLTEQVERRAELRELLGDMRELPEEQRAALLLAEAADLSHAEVAGVLGCEVARVKALVFRARTGLIERRAARETPCADIREQLANLRGGSLRRSELRHHVRNCPGCSEFREQVRRQRQMFAAALPVVPSMGLKSSVLSAAGIGGGAAGGGAAAAAGGGAAGAAAAAGGSGVALGGTIGSAAVAKVAIVAALAGGGVVAGEAAVQRVNGSDAAAPPAERPAGSHGKSDDAKSGAAGSNASARGERMRTERSHGRRGAERSAERSNGHSKAGTRSNPARERASDPGGRKLGDAKRPDKLKGTEPGGRGQWNAITREQSKAPTPRRAPTPKPAPQPKVSPQPKAQSQPAPPVSEPVAAPEPAPLPAPKPTPPGQLKLSK
jgi:RNA polymerase sigma factor (sigma-70 family)